MLTTIRFNRGTQESFFFTFNFVHLNCQVNLLNQSTTKQPIASHMKHTQFIIQQQKTTEVTKKIAIVRCNCERENLHKTNMQN